MTHSCVHFFLCLLQFGLFVNTIEDVSRIHYKTLFESTDGLSAMITAEASSFNMNFPNVTIPNFEVYGRDARLASKVELFSFSVQVSAEEVPQFNAYAASGKAQEWIAASQSTTNQMDGTPDREYDPIHTLPFIYDTTYDINTGEQSIAPSMGSNAEVAWQTSPVINNGFLLMSNLLSLTTGTDGQVGPYDVVKVTQGMHEHEQGDP